MINSKEIAELLIFKTDSIDSSVPATIFAVSLSLFDIGSDIYAGAQYLNKGNGTNNTLESTEHIFINGSNCSFLLACEGGNADIINLLLNIADEKGINLKETWSWSSKT